MTETKLKKSVLELKLQNKNGILTRIEILILTNIKNPNRIGIQTNK